MKRNARLFKRIRDQIDWIIECLNGPSSYYGANGRDIYFEDIRVLSGYLAEAGIRTPKEIF